ncbi:MAG: hypothetical protein H7061_01490, partial [Bdellovibrionaceae bacterium]|nr:hypothetical protein [Bdellovibrio sp.]
EQGWQRARLLPNLFTSRQEFKTFGLPAALYAMSPKKDDGSIRSIQTLKYVSEQFSIPIEKQFNRGQIKELVAKIKNEKKFNGKMVVICWEHKELVYIAGELGFSNLKDWPSKQYDRVWTFNFASDGTPVHFDNIPEKLLLSDSKD